MPVGAICAGSIRLRPWRRCGDADCGNSRAGSCAAQELLQAGAVQTGQVLVVGCSTSEVLGDKIGTGGSAEAAGAMFAALRRVTEAQGVFWRSSAASI